MEYGAIDLHTKESEIRIVEADGRGRARATDGDDAGATDGGVRRRAHPCASCWRVAPAANGSRSISRPWATRWSWPIRITRRCTDTRQRRIKTDRRDVAALAEANRLGVYRAAHRVSVPQRDVRRRLRVREQLVHVRRQAINLLRAQLRSEGVRVPTGAADTFRRTVHRVGGLGRGARRDGAVAGAARGDRAVDRPGRTVGAPRRPRRIPWRAD